jgi:hypothetical protein
MHERGVRGRARRRLRGTLDEVLSRPLPPELRAAVKGLLSQIAAAGNAIAEIGEESNNSCAGS